MDNRACDRDDSSLSPVPNAMYSDSLTDVDVLSGHSRGHKRDGSIDTLDTVPMSSYLASENNHNPASKHRPGPYAFPTFDWNSSRP